MGGEAPHFLVMAEVPRGLAASPGATAACSREIEAGEIRSQARKEVVIR
jgi:hypothetical protein